MSRRPPSLSALRQPVKKKRKERRRTLFGKQKYFAAVKVQTELRPGIRKRNEATGRKYVYRFFIEVNFCAGRL